MLKSTFQKSVTSMLLATALLLSQSICLQAAPKDWDDFNRNKIQHVFVIVLENEGYDTTFGAASKAPYLSKTLVSKGVLLSEYYGTGHVSLDNYIAMISGQAATN